MKYKFNLLSFLLGDLPRVDFNNLASDFHYIL
jgi:hypothetical protein